MVDPPTHETQTDPAKGQTEDNVFGVGGPQPAASQEPPPTPCEYQHSNKKCCRWTNDPAMFFVTLAGVIAVLVYTGVTKQQLAVMQDQVDDSRAQISGFLTIPETPETVVKLGNNWHFILDFYLANVGQTSARETYVSMILTMEGGVGPENFYTVSISGGPMLISTQTPWHHVFDFGLPWNTTIYEGVPKPGEVPKTSKMMMFPMRNIRISLKGKTSFTSVFGKIITQPIDLVAGFTDEHPCCDFQQLLSGVPMIYPSDLTRIPVGDDKTHEK
jgi:hypothetical protein